MPADLPSGRRPLACRVLGHRWRFAAQGATLRWDCARCAAPGGRKRYASAADANRYARALEGEVERGGRRFMLGTAPLWLWRRLRRHRGG